MTAPDTAKHTGRGNRSTSRRTAAAPADIPAFTAVLHHAPALYLETRCHALVGDQVRGGQRRGHEQARAHDGQDQRAESGREVRGGEAETDPGREDRSRRGWANSRRRRR
ncbi:hypothetical protein STENM327S_00888 [Streptomyces tendae]